MKQIAWITSVSLATIMAVLVFWEFRVALVLFILSLTVAAVLRPFVDWLRALGLPRSLALLFTYLVVISIIAGLALILAEPIITELQTITRDLSASFEQLKNQWLSGSVLQQTIVTNFQDFNNLFRTVTGGKWNIQNFLGTTIVSLDLTIKISIILVLSIYWSADQEHFKRLWLSLLPAGWRTRSRSAWQNIEREIGSYLRSELIQSLLTVIFLGVGYQLIGLKYPAILALIGAIGWLIIWFGGLIAVLPALLVGLSISPVIGLVAALFTIAFLAFLEFIVEPRLYDRQHLSSLLVVIIVLLMVSQYGIIGFFIAPPLAAAIQIIARQLIHPTTVPKSMTTPSQQFEILKERLFSVKIMIATRPGPPAPEIINLVGRLDELIERAHQAEHQPE